MPQGEVGGGHQNEYKRDGIIYLDGDRDKPQLKFVKEIRTGVTRDHHQAWTSGTPIEWDDINVGNDRTIKSAGDLRLIQETIYDESGNYKVDMLVSRDADGRATYHPLIQFYNEILARVINEGLRVELDNLNSATHAMRLWMYLETYLKPADTKRRKEIIALVKKR